MVRSCVWNYFNADKKDKFKATCKFCNQSYKSGHVDRMMNHLKECKKIPPYESQNSMNKILFVHYIGIK